MTARNAGGEFRFVAGPWQLAFFFAEAVSDLAVAALTVVSAITVAGDLAWPDRQRRQSKAQE